MQGEIVTGTGFHYTEPPMWEKVGHVPPSLPTEKQVYKMERSRLDSALTSAQRQHKVLLSQYCSIYFTKMLRTPAMEQCNQ